MTGRDLREMLEPSSTDEVMDVDTSFLDAYRRGGTSEVKRLRERELREQALQQDPAPLVEHPNQDVDPDEDLDDDREQREEHDDTTPRIGDDHDLSRDQDRDEPHLEPEHEPDEGDSERSGTEGTSQRGGAGGSGAALPDGAPASSAASTPPVSGSEQPDVEDDAETAVTGPEHSSSDPGADLTSAPPSALRHTDQQDAIQSTASTRGGSGSGSDTATLPQSGFRVLGASSQPNIKALPESIIGVLREQVRAAAVRELGVSDSAAREFSLRLSQGTLVTGFLLAHLDVRLDVDPATERTAELFRSQDPLLGGLVARMEGLEAAGREQGVLLRRVRDEVRDVHQTSAVTEQLVAYSVADRSENFLRGGVPTQEAPITDKRVVQLRDRARDQTKKQLQIEKEREGRPIR